jgi:hypothetical protein
MLHKIKTFNRSSIPNKIDNNTVIIINNIFIIAQLRKLKLVAKILELFWVAVYAPLTPICLELTNPLRLYLDYNALLTLFITPWVILHEK